MLSCHRTAMTSKFKSQGWPNCAEKSPLEDQPDIQIQVLEEESQDPRPQSTLHDVAGGINCAKNCAQPK